MTQRSINQHDITVLNAHIPNNRPSVYMKQKVIGMQREIDKSTIIIKNFIIPLLIEQVGMKISKAIDFNGTIDQFELTVIYTSNNRIQIIFNCLWNIYQDMPYSEP